MPLPTTTPRDAGVDAQGILDLLDAAAHLELHSLAIARDGQALARGWWAPYSPDRRTLLYSCSKSITATTVAALQAEGVLSLDDPILSRLPRAALAGAGDIAEIWRQVTIRHCLTMTVGHTTDAWRRDLGREPLHTIMAHPPEAAPGTVFAYNQVATYLLSRAVEHATGKPLDQVAMEKVLEPLGIPGIDWDRDCAGHPYGFSGARLRTDDLLALTQLWLDGGASEGSQVLPQGWVEEASQPFLQVPDGSSSDWEHGYGQSFWIARHGFRADGALGQYGIVLPEHRMAIAITSEIPEMQEPLDLIWEHLLPAVDREGSEDADDRLAQRLESLSIPALSASAGPTEHRSWAVDPASDLATSYAGVRVDAEGTELILQRDGTDLAIAVGDGVWVETDVAVEGRRVPLAASGGWSEGGYIAEVRVLQTPHSFRVTTGPGAALLRWRNPPLATKDPVSPGAR